jgi:hypothetical protein
VHAGSHGGNHVEVEGSFDNWTTRQPLQHTGKDWTIIKLLPPGVYQYKFIVDGDWRYDPNQPAMYDEMSNVNNVIEVQEYVPENLDNVSGFEPPPSPPSSYANAPPAAEDYAKEPPVMPPHLQLTLLNVPPADSGASLPRPQHVILGHLYLQRGQVRGVGGVGGESGKGAAVGAGFGMLHAREREVGGGSVRASKRPASYQLHTVANTCPTANQPPSPSPHNPPSAHPPTPRTSTRSSSARRTATRASTSPACCTSRAPAGGGTTARSTFQTTDRPLAGSFDCAYAASAAA